MAKAIGQYSYEVNISGEAASRPVYTRILAKDANLKESWFRDAIFDNPEIVIDVCREAGLVGVGESWYAWAREFNLDAGPVDVLLLSSRGRIGVVETKLSFNPERRREVVAQICDYALALQEKAYEELPEKPIINNTELPTENDIRESLSLGNFLLIIAGDQIDPRALRLGTAILTGHLTSAWDLAMVDMNLFVDTTSQPPRYLMIPELRGQLVAETRQVVRVIVQGEKPEAKIKVERIIPPRPGPPEPPWFAVNGAQGKEMPTFIERCFKAMRDPGAIAMDVALRKGIDAEETISQFKDHRRYGDLMTRFPVTSEELERIFIAIRSAKPMEESQGIS
jgi:hypothetical protein